LTKKLPFEAIGLVVMRSIGVYSVIKTTANHAIIYINRVRYSGLKKRHTMIYFLPNNINPIIKIIQKEKAKLVLIKNGLSK
jgi:hypothetical protein